MARIRTIKPEFWTDETIADLRDPWTRLLFIGLWNHCDDAGRCVDNPRLIKAAVFPLDDQIGADDVARMLLELAERARIVRYETDGKRLIQVANWHHQFINRPSKSNLPGPNDFGPVPPGRGQLMEDSMSAHGTLKEGSIPDQGSGIRDQGSSSTQVSTNSPSYPQVSEDDDEDTSPERIRTIIELAADDRIRRANGVKNPTAYRRTVIAELLTTDALTVRRLIHDYPTAPDGILAAAVNGDRHSLRYHREGA